MRIEDLHSETQKIVVLEIGQEEKVLWIGIPNTKTAMLASLRMVLFAIPWTAFSIFWICGAAGFKYPTWQGPQSLFPLFGLPFLFIGLGMLTSPYWIKKAAQRSAYIITNRRAICINWKIRSAEIVSFDAARISQMSKKIKSNGSGDIIFDKKEQGSGQYKAIGFIGLDDVKLIEEILKKVF